MTDLRAHYVAVVRDDRNELDRGREMFDVSDFLDGLEPAVSSLRDFLFGFDAEDVRTWCRVELRMDVWSRDDAGRRPVLDTVFWSSVDVDANVSAPARILEALPVPDRSDDVRELLERARIDASRLLSPYLRIVRS